MKLALVMGLLAVGCQISEREEQASDVKLNEGDAKGESGNWLYWESDILIPNSANDGGDFVVPVSVRFDPLIAAFGRKWNIQLVPTKDFDPCNREVLTFTGKEEMSHKKMRWEVYTYEAPDGKSYDLSFAYYEGEERPRVSFELNAKGRTGGTRELPIDELPESSEYWPEDFSLSECEGSGSGAGQ